MTYTEAIIMGIFQGFSEFLPISSSGHLAVLQNIFHIKEGNLFLAEMLHMGTLLSIFAVYFSEIKLMIVEFIKLIIKVVKREKITVNRYQKFSILIIFATIPTVIIALIFKKYIDGLYKNLTFIAVSFIITGVLLMIAQKNYRETKNIKEMTPKDALIIGLMQGVAILPGISRSGLTIVAALFCGLKKNVATEFSFILSIPAVLGASILGFLDLVKGKEALGFSIPLVLGVTLSFIVGVVSIKILVKILNKGKLSVFSYYLWAVGIVVLAASLFKIKALQ